MRESLREEAGSVPVRQGLGGEGGLRVVTCEDLRSSLDSLGRVPFDGLGGGHVQGAPAVLVQASIRRLLRERMLERVEWGGGNAGFEQELSSLKSAEIAAELVVGYVDDGAQEWQGDILAEHGRRLQKLLLFRAQTM